MRFLTWMLVLLLSVTATAQDSRFWLLTMSDLQPYCPAGYQVNAKAIDQSDLDLVTVRLLKYRYSDRQAGIFLHCQLAEYPSSLRAEMGYALIKGALSLGPEFRDYSTVIKAGEASQCGYSQQFDCWKFSYRHKRVRAAILLRGLHLTPAQMSRVVHEYTSRIAALEAPKPKPRSKSKGIWRF